MHLFLIAFVIVVAVAIPPKRLVPSDCRVAEEEERCSGIIEEAMKGEAWTGGLKSRLQQYCRKITDFVPCLEEDKAVYAVLTECQEHYYSDLLLRFEGILTWDSAWNMSIDFLDTVNSIICTRTDEIIKLIECIKSKDRKQFQPLLGMCAGQHMSSLGTAFQDDTEMIDQQMVCSAVTGFASCMKTVLTSMCGTEFSGLLDTVYEDVIDGVIGKAFSCEVSNPLLDFVRTVRNKYKR